MFCYARGYNNRKMYLILNNTGNYVYKEMYLVYRNGGDYRNRWGNVTHVLLCVGL